MTYYDLMKRLIDSALFTSEEKRMMHNQDKLTRLVALIEQQQIERLKERKLDCEENITGCRVSVKPGRKYIKVDVGTSGKLMIDAKTEEIFGIKAYGQVHKGHRYGTLDTIDEWYWGEFYPRLKNTTFAIRLTK